MILNPSSPQRLLRQLRIATKSGLFYSFAADFGSHDSSFLGCQPRNPNDSPALASFLQKRAICSPFHRLFPTFNLTCFVHEGRGLMPSMKARVPHNRKRQLSKAEPESDLLPQPPTKQQKLEEHHHRTPDSFWDNLSRQWLTRRTLREFDKRTVWPATPISPRWIGKENIDLAKLKRFARHGGPVLDNIRGVSQIQLLSKCSIAGKLLTSYGTKGLPQISLFK